MNRITKFRIRDRNKVVFYTGLEDKNGREIYEGDILQLNGDMDKGKSLVTFENGSFTNGHGVPIYNIILENEGDNWEKNISKIIGNIFENPELLNAHNEQKDTVPS